MADSNLIRSHQKARTRPSSSKVVHARYHEREDLRGLAKCDNINGPICDDAHLTSDDKTVTCKRCLRIIAGVAVTVRSRPFSDADYRLMARLGREAPRHPEPSKGYKRPDGVQDNSAWAPLHDVRDWLLRLADEDEVPIEINVQAKEMADKLTASIPRLGGGKA